MKESTSFDFQDANQFVFCLTTFGEKNLSISKRCKIFLTRCLRSTVFHLTILGDRIYMKHRFCQPLKKKDTNFPHNVPTSLTIVREQEKSFDFQVLGSLNVNLSFPIHLLFAKLLVYIRKRGSVSSKHEKRREKIKITKLSIHDTILIKLKSQN